MIEKFPEIVSRLAGVVEQFATALDCVDTGFLSDGIPDELPTGAQLGATNLAKVSGRQVAQLINENWDKNALNTALTQAGSRTGATPGPG